MHDAIENSQAVTNLLGYWPSFHDAEIHALRCERQGNDAPFLECAFSVERDIRHENRQGATTPGKRVMITLRFCHASLESLSGWNEQNVIFDLVIRSCATPGRAHQMEISVEA